MKYHINKFVLFLLAFFYMSAVCKGQDEYGRIERDTLKMGRDFNYCYRPFESSCIDEVIIHRWIAVNGSRENLRRSDSLFYSRGRIVLKVERNTSRGGVIRTFFSDSLIIRLDFPRSEKEFSSFWLHNLSEKTGFSVSFNNGLINARSDMFYPNDSTEISVIKRYAENPRYIEERIEFKNNVYHGQYIRFHPNGRVKEQTTMVDGFGEGPSYTYNELGTLLEINCYKRGNRQGWSTYFNEDGSVRKQSLYEDDICIKGCD